MPFLDRTDAGRRLATALAGYRQQRPVVLALPRGGVPVAAEVAQALAAPLDLLIVRKLGVPWHRELAMGAVVNGGDPIVVRNDDVIRSAGITEADIAAVSKQELAEIERRRRRYLGDRSPVDVAGCTAIIVDDGIATGATIRAALKATRLRKPAKRVLAVPVAPTDTIDALRADADDVVCLERYEPFGAISLYYDDFRQVADDEVMEILARFPAR